ncbi:MAG: Nif11-like leader peptide family RiPP precursor [Lachnospiraceae bacterium]|nr:Nif11-like leader peptide family RiPP precursor [Lachnospiraceae bacterium]
MNENIKVFLKKMAEDQELFGKMSACKNPDEAYAIASSVVGGFTKEEFISTMDKLDAAAKGSKELSDEDLKNIAGGDVDIDWADVGIGVAASASSFGVTYGMSVAAAAAAI